MFMFPKVRDEKLLVSAPKLRQWIRSFQMIPSLNQCTYWQKNPRSLLKTAAPDVFFKWDTQIAVTCFAQFFKWKSPQNFSHTICDTSEKNASCGCSACWSVEATVSGVHLPLWTLLLNIYVKRVYKETYALIWRGAHISLCSPLMFFCYQTPPLACQHGMSTWIQSKTPKSVFA